MNPLDQSIEAAGGVGALASLIGVTQTAVSNWRARGGVPAIHCATIEMGTGIKRWSLRPDDWHRIWPELIGAEGAPAVETTVKVA